MKSIFYLLITILLGGLHAHADNRVAIKAPEWTVEHFSFGSTYADKDITKTELFIFSWVKSGFSIKSRLTDNMLVQGAYYIKTFGGNPPTVRTHLINKRFLVIPTTIKNSVIPDADFHAMMAVTSIYDLKTEKLLGKSKPYKYDHDVPLRYNKDGIRQTLHKEQNYPKK